MGPIHVVEYVVIIVMVIDSVVMSLINKMLLTILIEHLRIVVFIKYENVTILRR